MEAASFIHFQLTVQLQLIIVIASSVITQSVKTTQKEQLLVNLHPIKLAGICGEI